MVVTLAASIYAIDKKYRQVRVFLRRLLRLPIFIRCQWIEKHVTEAKKIVENKHAYVRFVSDLKKWTFSSRTLYIGPDSNLATSFSVWPRDKWKN